MYDGRGDDDMIETFAPGRAELLGNHTDYNGGLVLALALRLGVTARGEARPDARLAIRSTTLGRAYQGDLGSLAPSRDEPWANYVLGVVHEFRRRGASGPGFELEIDSTVPVGAGLSSSAALECATARFLQELWGTSFGDLELALIAQAAEHGWAGVSCGLLDQLSSLFGEPGAAVLIDCRSLEVERLPLPSSVAFVAARSGVAHALVAGEYNARRATCEAAARALGVATLRDVDTAALLASGSLSTLELRRALHVVGETERVARAGELLRRGDVEGLGPLMFDSHGSSRINFENSCAELDLLVEAAATAPGCLGARLSGGGFGGSTINLVRSDSLDAFREHLASDFRRHLGRSLETILC
jgi:galactokinase